MKEQNMQLTLGANLFHWAPDKWRDFYIQIADEAEIDRVVLGEMVCSKRLPFYEVLIPEVAERLQRAGKEVVLASLALVTLPRERKQMAGLVNAGFKVEINDLTMLHYLDLEQDFSVGPLVNVYNTDTINWLSSKGATDICLPPELSIGAVKGLAEHGRKCGTGIEVWAYGRVPLAISGRCTHARLAKKSKDSCQFVCENDEDGLAVDTLSGQKFLAVNGVQTLSESRANLIADIPSLEKAGVTSLRLSPHTEDMVHVAKTFRAVCNHQITSEEALVEFTEKHPDHRYCNGFLFGEVGANWSHF
ncbi:MAG: U32 family peptidase [Robiginitomaculum sp.]|nr:U32 family peptidase [Robiginitomaculum sp.]